MSKRVLKTRLCDMLGIEYPILSAGMGPTLVGENTGAPVELVVAVSEAGGLGVLGGSGFTVDELQKAIREIKKQTDRPFGVDLLLPKYLNLETGSVTAKKGQTTIPLTEVIKTLPRRYQDWYQKVRDEHGIPEPDDVNIKLDSTARKPVESVRVCLDERVPLFCAGLGNPGFMVEEAHAAGMKVLGITGNAKNAKRMADSGIDLLVAQGHEGGGHTGRIGTMALVPAAIDAAAPVPVLAAGGIGDGRGIAAALAMGCAGVWIGTRFLATDEGGALDINKQKILESNDEGTRVSTAYTGKTLRASYNKYHDLWAGSGLDPIPFPGQVIISSALLSGFIKAGKNDYIGGLAGQVSGIIHEIKPAAQVLEDLVAETVEILSNTLPKSVVVE